MSSTARVACLGLTACLLQACSPSPAPAATAAGAQDAPTPAVEAAPAPQPVAPASAPGAAGGGTAHVDFSAEGVAVAGDYPAGLCGGPYLMGEGVAWQVTADGWQVTVAMEERRSGTIEVAPGADRVGVIATVNGPGGQYVRKRSLGGTLTVSEDFARAQADLELGEVVGAGVARLKARFDCG